MRKKHRAFNSSLDEGYFGYPKISQAQERILLGQLFEQLMLFDRVYIKTGRVNYALFFLMKNFGAEFVERLVNAEYIKFLVYTPLLVVNQGRQREDGSIDTTTMLGQPPVVSGTIQAHDDFKHKLVMSGIDPFQIPQRRKKKLVQNLLGSFIVPDGMLFAKDSAKLVIDAYEGNLLQDVGLSYNRPSDQLDVKERSILQGLGYDLLDNALMSQYDLKSFCKTENFKIHQRNLKNIGDALQVTSNAIQIFDIENIPNLTELYLQENISFERLMKLRHGSTAKYFRNWLNETSENLDAAEITEAYIDEIKDKKGFFQTTGGKFIKTTTTFALGAGMGIAIGEPTIGLPASYGLRLIDTYVLQNLIQGKNAKMFVDRIKKELE